MIMVTFVLRFLAQSSLYIYSIVVTAMGQNFGAYPCLGIRYKELYEVRKHIANTCMHFYMKV